MRQVLLTIVLGVLPLGFAACGDDDDDGEGGPAATEPAATEPAASGTAGETGATSTGGDGATLTISGFAFAEGVTGSAGSTITVVNEDSATHTVTAHDGAFDVTVEGGQSGELVLPAEPGSYDFHCNIHASMQGTLTVE